MYTLEMNTAFIPDSLCQILPEDVLEVEIEFNYLPATQDKLYGHPDTWYQGDNEEFEITNIYYYNLDAWIKLGYDDIQSVDGSLYEVCKDYVENLGEDY